MCHLQRHYNQLMLNCLTAISSSVVIMIITMINKDDNITMSD